MLLRARAGGAACALGALLLLTAAAAGQATFGALPDPITTRELLGLLGRLDPSEEQIAAAERAHDAYKAAFGTLRDREIADYLRAWRGRTDEIFPDRASVDDLRRRGASVREAIARLDERLFDAIGDVLTEDQLVALPRVRLERARARLLDEPLRIPTEDIVDLAALAHDLELAPRDRLAADPAIAAYEVQLTERLRALARKNRRLDAALLDRMDGLGFTASDLDAPARRERMFAAMRAYWSDVEREMVRRSEDARRLGRRTCDATAPLLSPAAGRRLRDAYYREAYPDLDAAFPALAELMRRIEADESVPPDRRATVTTLREGYEAAVDAVLTRAADALDAFLADRMPFDVDSEAEAVLDEQLDREASVAMMLHESAVLQLREAIGPAGIDRYDLHDVAAAIEIALGWRGPSTAAADADGREDSAPPDLLPPPLAKDEVAALAAALDLDDAGRTALDTARAEHAAGYRAARAALDEIMGDVIARLDRLEGEPDADAASAALLDRAYDARRRFRATSAGLDATFLTRARVLRPSDADRPILDAWARARQRRVLALGPEPDAFPGAVPETRIDVLALASSAGLDRAALAAREADLAAYEEALLEAMRARAELAETYLEWSDRVTIAPGSPGVPGAAEAAAGSRLDTAERALEAVGGRIVDLNRSIVAVMVEALGPEAGAALDRAYARAAHPDVYDDPASVGVALAAVLARDDLTGDQRAALRELAAAYHPAYEGVCRAMIDLDDRAARGAIDGLEYGERWGRLHFERDEINARAERRLRVITGDALVIRRR